MNRSWSGSIIRVLLLCLVVGLVLSVTGLSPESLLSGLGSTVERIFKLLVDMFRWAVPYILIGAVLVIPIWLVLVIWRVARRRH